MKTSDKLQLLQQKCKAGVYVQINDHKNEYKTVEDYLIDYDVQIGDEVRNEMISRDTTISLGFYPDTPVGFVEIYHYDLDKALSIAIQWFNK